MERKKNELLVKHFRFMNIFSIKTIFLYRYGGWSFGLPLTKDLRFDITTVPANRTLAKVNCDLSFGTSYK